MADAPAISREPPKRASQDFSRLREAALARVRKLAATTWTDHNHHDPGITILEAFCYAMTEIGLKLDLDVADLIASGSGRATPAMPPASEVLPVAPVTHEDLRHRLVDHYLLSDARVSRSVSDHVAYYADPGQSPPLSYTPPVGSAPVLPGGLHDALLAFRDNTLNSNTYGFQPAVGPVTVAIEIALPHWDEPEAAPFLDGDRTLTAVTMLNPANPWRQLEESLTYYGRASLDHTGPGGPAATETWLVMRVVNAPVLPASALPPLLAAARGEVESMVPGTSLGAQFLDRVARARAAAVTVGRDLRSWRNLTEAPLEIAVSRIQEIGVNARIEVARTTGLEELLADILTDIDRGLTPPLRFIDADAARAKGLGNEDILDGPLLAHGVLAPPEGERLVRIDKVLVSDILRLLLAQRGATATRPSPDNPLGREVIAVTELSLSNFINNRVITARAAECLRLVDIARHRPQLSVPKCRIVFVRDDVAIAYDHSRVEALVAARRAEAESTARLPEHEPTPPISGGTAFEIGDYYPFQYDLPAIYGVSEVGLPADATTERKQQVRQLRAFLLLMEQFLGDASEQLASINRLFSPSVGEDSTYFTRPLYSLDGLDALVRRDTSTPWDAFVADPANTYATALAGAVEDGETAVDRRNRMLDHLLARQGEDMAAWGQELHRWGQKALLRTTVNLAALPQRIVARRLAVNRALLRSKAAFLDALRRLHALRLQAFGDPSQWDDGGLITVTRSSAGYRWQLQLEGTPVFAAPVPVPTRGEAVARAREVLRLSGRAGFYDVMDLGGSNNRRYVLRSGTAAGTPVIAHGATGFPNLPAAAAAAIPVRQGLAHMLIAQSRTAMERRIDFQSGLRVRTRRRLLMPLSVHFAVVDAASPPPFVKSWQLWAGAGHTDRIMLEATVQFSDPSEAAAVAAAEADVERMLEFALDDWHWRILEVGPGSWTLDLVDFDDRLIAAAPASFTDRPGAEVARDALVDLLYDRYGGEGFHIVETLLLRPQSGTDVFLDIPDGEGPALSDPYSHRVVVVLPSGYARDFASIGSARVPARPHRFRDPEFRRHITRMIRQSCPAHIFPEIRWVDREVPGSAAAPGSFDTFEARFFAWLDTEIMPGAPVATTATARNDLVAALNALLNG